MIAGYQRESGCVRFFSQRRSVYNVHADLRRYVFLKQPKGEAAGFEVIAEGLGHSPESL